MLLLYAITSEDREIVLMSIKLNLDLDEFDLDLFRWMRTEGSLPKLNWFCILLVFRVTLRKNKVSVES